MGLVGAGGRGARVKTADAVKKLDAAYRSRSKNVTREPDVEEAGRWRSRALPPAAPLEPLAARRELEPEEIDFLNDAIASRFEGLERDFLACDADDFEDSGEGARALGILQEGGDPETTRHRLEVALVDFRSRCEAEERSRAKKAEKAA